MTYNELDAILRDLRRKGFDANEIERYRMKAELVKFRPYEHCHDELRDYNPLLTGIVDKYIADGNGQQVIGA